MVKNLLRCIGSFVMAGILSYLLLLCLKVKSHHHFLFVSHPVATIEDTNSVKAGVCFFLTNIEGDSEMSYKFISDNRKKRDNVLAPQYYNMEAISRLSGLDFNEISRYALKAHVPMDSLTDLYTVVNLETASSPNIKYSEDITPRQKSVFIHREFLMGDNDFRITHAYLVEHALLSAIEQENKHLTNSIFLFGNQRLVNKSYYVLTSKGKEVESDSRHSTQGVTKWIAKFFEPSDITRERHSFIIHSEAIDTLSLKLRFDEKVELSPLNREPSAEGSQTLLFDDITTCGEAIYASDSKYLYSDVGSRSANFHLSYYRQKGRENSFSFWVKYMSSEKIQWLRLFFLTTLLGFFLTEFLLSIFKIVVVLLKSCKHINK